MNTVARDTKTTLKAEVRIIPAVGWAVAGVVLLLWLAVVTPLILGTVKPKPGEPPVELLGAILIFSGAVLTIFVLMIFYVNADAGRRQMSRLLWTLLVIFIPNAIGFIVYFLVRKPIARPCGHCGQAARPEFTFCPACGTSLSATCPACSRGVEAGWANCAFCGTKLS